MEKHNTARQPIIVLVSLYSCDCIITFAMDYGYVPPDQTYQTLKYHEMILLQTLHGGKKENIRRIAITVLIHSILEKRKYLLLVAEVLKKQYQNLLQTRDGNQCHFCANKIF